LVYRDEQPRGLKRRQRSEEVGRKPVKAACIGCQRAADLGRGPAKARSVCRMGKRSGEAEQRVVAGLPRRRGQPVRIVIEQR
jgi:hypothetical protein